MNESQKSLFYEVLYQYSHFLLAVYAMFLICCAGFLFLCAVFSAIFLSFYAMLFFAMSVAALFFGLDVFSRSVYNYPFFAMFVNCSKYRFVNRFFELSYMYVKVCYLVNAYFCALLYVFCSLAWLHFMLFFRLHLRVRFYIGVSVFLLAILPVVCEVFYYGWSNKSLYFVPKVLKNSSKESVFL